MKKIKTNGGEMEFFMMILLFLVVIFVIWAFTGGPQGNSKDKPFITPGNNTDNPLQVYGPGEKQN